MHIISQESGYRVLPAFLLSDEPVNENDASSLRRDASSNGVCYVQVVRSFHDGTHLARVAAHPELLLTQAFTIVLNDAQLLDVSQVRTNDESGIEPVPGRA